ncbi:hypothetical protein [Marinicella litoralis]|uniref:Uncharacterized protein n=1 Tax=Marinicella litoralis TaxID=644220 RepID=A0A4R6XM07_9GAMM|nr:hypothetical protein [Marinicella litoralis]TDR20675.1 hypothetical protein C8D91_1651 [Marinicella litoralis]
MKKILIIIILMAVFNGASAVNTNPGGYGEAVILPYYTVNNNLNTVMTINNSTEMTKAIKVHFREGREGKAVLTFNVYLGPNDIWAAALVPAVSTVFGHEGEDSVRLFFVDNSCAPFLFSGQEFLPFEVDAESDDTDMLRSREGFIEVIEMGELDPVSGLGFDARPTANGDNNCANLEAALAGGIWDEDNGGDLTAQLLPVNGGITANLGIIDVAEGVMFSVDGVALENFFPADSLFHTTTGETRIPSLNHADTTSVVINDDGEPISTQWEHGYQAVSAVLMKYQLESFYDVEPNIAAKTEVVLTMPTKRFYLGSNLMVEQPFTHLQTEQYYSCARYDTIVSDRDATNSHCSTGPYGPGCYNNPEISTVKLTPIPPPVEMHLCYDVSVLQLLGEDSVPGFEGTQVLGSPYFDYRDVYSFQAGKLRLDLGQMVTSPSGEQYHGLPVLASTFTKYTNANAAPGLMAQYGGVHEVFYKTRVDPPAQ